MKERKNGSSEGVLEWVELLLYVDGGAIELSSWVEGGEDDAVIGWRRW